MIDFRNVKKILLPEGWVSSITMGGKTLWRRITYKRELAYLESSGTQWIDTGHIPTNNTRIELDASGFTAESFALSATGTWICGGRQGYLNRAYGFYYDQSKLKFFCAFGNAMPGVGYSNLYNRDVTLGMSKGGFFVDDGKLLSFSVSTFSAPVTLLIFGLNNNGRAISTTAFKLHGFKIWESETLVRDFVPVIDMNDIACLYDKVSGQLFYNKGTGEFGYGELPRLPLEYQEVEYIESTGTQWIDTGMTINTLTDELELRFELLDTRLYKWFFGEYDTNAQIGLGSGDGADKRNHLYQQAATKVKDVYYYNGMHTFVANQTGTYQDEVKIRNFVNFSSTSSIYLFNININSASDYRAIARIWEYKHTRNSVLICNLIPCYRKSDNKPGMYDLVSKTFFTNAGTGDFSKGENDEPEVATYSLRRSVLLNDDVADFVIGAKVSVVGDDGYVRVVPITGEMPEIILSEEIYGEN